MQGFLQGGMHSKNAQAQQELWSLQRKWEATHDPQYAMSATTPTALEVLGWVEQGTYEI